MIGINTEKVTVEQIEKMIIVGIKSELRFVEHSKKYWITDRELELGSRVLLLGNTIIDNIEHGYGIIGYEDYLMSIREYNEDIVDHRKSAAYEKWTMEKYKENVENNKLTAE